MWKRDCVFHFFWSWVEKGVEFFFLQARILWNDHEVEMEVGLKVEMESKRRGKRRREMRASDITSCMTWLSSRG